MKLTRLVRVEAVVLVLELAGVVACIQRTLRRSRHQAAGHPQLGRSLQVACAFISLRLQWVLSGNYFAGVKTYLLTRRILDAAKRLEWVFVDVSHSFSEAQLFLRCRFGPLRQVNNLGTCTAATPATTPTK